uniref:TNFR-Cys domain-containing protein n=1 Tax=Oncorhynchus kisutch TaxID=8019 RepID=A0A8C7DJZ7_ONCKI
MEGLSMEASVSAALLMASCLLALSEPSCNQTQFLHSNGSCADCPVCGPGEQLTDDCGYGDGGEGGRCVACAEGQFSTETGLAPCWQCTRCILLNRQERAVCSPINNAQCGNCLPGYYKLRSRSGEVDLLCMPCYSPTGKIRKECLPLQWKHTSTAVTLDTVQVSMALIGSVTSASIFLLLLLLWALLLIIERFGEFCLPVQTMAKKCTQFPIRFLYSHKVGMECGLYVFFVFFVGCSEQVRKYCPEGLHFEVGTAFPRNTLLSNTTETGAIPSITPPESPGPTQDAHHRCLSSLSREGEVHPTSIVINVTTNIKPSLQHGGEDGPWEGQRGHCHTPEEMEQKLLEICTVSQGQSLEELNYDTVQDLSLLLDSGGCGRGSGVRRLGYSLGVTPEVLSNLHGFQDLFQYLRTSTYILLPQLAQAAALLPRPDVVARIHRGLVANHTEISRP